MYFTLVFSEIRGQGPSFTYDLVFHPCPVWMKGGEQVIVPNGDSPKYLTGHLGILFETEKNIENIDEKTEVVLVVHTKGESHGTEQDLEVLIEDIKNQGFIPLITRL